MDERNIHYNRFLWLWLVNGIGAWPISLIASGIVWAPIMLVALFLGRVEAMTSLLHLIILSGLLILPGMTIGYCVGDLQYGVIRGHLRWSMVGWRRESIRGGIFGGILAIVGWAISTAYFPANVQWIVMMPLFAFGLSIGQWSVLRRITVDSWMWVLANVAGGLVFSGLLFLNQPLLASPYSAFGVLLLWLLAVLVQGAITGIVLLWLYDHRTGEYDFDEDDDEYARVYLEVRRREDDHWIGLQ